MDFLLYQSIQSTTSGFSIGILTYNPLNPGQVRIWSCGTKIWIHEGLPPQPEEIFSNLPSYFLFVEGGASRFPYDGAKKEFNFFFFWGYWSELRIGRDWVTFLQFSSMISREILSASLPEAPLLPLDKVVCYNICSGYHAMNNAVCSYWLLPMNNQPCSLYLSLTGRFWSHKTWSWLQNKLSRKLYETERYKGTKHIQEKRKIKEGSSFDLMRSSSQTGLNINSRTSTGSVCRNSLSSSSWRKGTDR